MKHIKHFLFLALLPVYFTGCRKPEKTETGPEPDQKATTSTTEKPSIASLKLFFAKLTGVKDSEIVFNSNTSFFSVGEVGLPLKDVEELYQRAQARKSTGISISDADTASSINNLPID